MSCLYVNCITVGTEFELCRIRVELHDLPFNRNEHYLNNHLHLFARKYV